MILKKTVRLPFPFNETDFFILDEVVSETEDEEVSRRNLYMADDAAPGGMVLVKRGALYSFSKAEFEWPPKRVAGMKPLKNGG